MNSLRQPARKSSRTRPERHATLGNPVAGVYPLLLTVAKGQKVEKFGYYLSALPCDLGGRAFRLTKVEHQIADGPDHYDVLIDGANHSCECLGHLRHGHKTVCKHAAALRALVAGGKLPVEGGAR
jgi:hypothetical protein